MRRPNDGPWVGLWLAWALTLIAGCGAPWQCPCERAVFYGGKLDQIVNVSLASTYEAGIHVLEDLELPIVEESLDELSGRVASRMKHGEPILITLDAMGDSHTRVRIRVGMEGDKERAAAFMDLIETYLDG